MNAIELGRQVILMESDCLIALSNRLDDSFTRAVELLQKKLLSSVGKSSLLA